MGRWRHRGEQKEELSIEHRSLYWKTRGNQLFLLAFSSISYIKKLMEHFHEVGESVGYLYLTKEEQVR